jgi:four helix bundle protein
MAKYMKFEELPAWKEAALLYNRVLDLLEEPGVPLSMTFRNQLERAALSVSNNIAEGFERTTTAELLSFLTIARGSGGEVRSMMVVVRDRPKLRKFAVRLEELTEIAQSCARQLTAWSGAISDSAVQGKRYLNGKQRERRKAADAAKEFKLNFLRNLKREHPLYNSAEAKEARGEAEAEE